MDNIKNYAIGIVGGASILLALYFFWHKPEVNEAYKRGLNECQSDTDTLFIKGDREIVYRDTTFNVVKNIIINETDTVVNLSSKFDTTAVFGRDTIRATANVSFLNSESAIWDLFISHKDFEQLPDTIQIKTPYYIEKIVKENNWLYNLIAYVGGLATAIVLFLL